jgi:hypothetical protein
MMDSSDLAWYVSLRMLDHGSRSWWLAHIDDGSVKLGKDQALRGGLEWKGGALTHFTPN